MRYLDKEDREEVIEDLIKQFRAREIGKENFQTQLESLGLRKSEIDDLVIKARISSY